MSRFDLLATCAVIAGTVILGVAMGLIVFFGLVSLMPPAPDEEPNMSAKKPPPSPSVKERLGKVEKNLLATEMKLELLIRQVADIATALEELAKRLPEPTP